MYQAAGKETVLELIGFLYMRTFEHLSLKSGAEA